MTTVIARTIPTASEPYHANPFKLFIPRELEEAPARAIWTHLRENHSIVLADPFAMPGVSTVFPGILFDVAAGFHVDQVVNALNELAQKDEAVAEALADSWVELWVPEALEDQAAPLDVTDLTA